MLHRRPCLITSALLGVAVMICGSPSTLGLCTSPENVSALAEETESDAQQLWEKAVAAKGGRERLQSISSLYVVSLQTGGDRDYGFYVFPDYSFDYLYWRYRESVGI